jgi:hypothetical protein
MYFGGVGMHSTKAGGRLDERSAWYATSGSKAMILQPRSPATVAGLHNLFWLERACKAQVAAMACNTKLHLPSPEVIEKTNHLYRPETRRRWGPLEWPALLRLADRKYPGFRD